MSKVQCNSCTACCRGQLIVLVQGDAMNMHRYDFSEHIENGVTLRTLNEKPNGDCVHLGDRGCSIYEHRPKACRAYDCRMEFKTLSRNERREFDNRQIWKEARKRLHTLDAGDLARLNEYRAKAGESLTSMDWKPGGA